MLNYSKFTAWDQAVEITFDEIENSELTTMFAAGIVNPFGPTLKAIVLEGEYLSNNELFVLEISLNPFNQSVTILGKMHIGELWDFDRDMSLFMDSFFESCPTVLLLNKYLTPQETVKFCAKFLQTFNDGYELLQKVRNFPGDPWNRIQYDIDDLPNSVLRETPSKYLSDEEAIELAANLLQTENQAAELSAFKDAWNGSIEHSSMKRIAMSFKRFMIIFTALGQTCTLPD